MSKRILIVGAGFSGCVLAEQLSKRIPCIIDLFDSRQHIGGNCHTERDDATNIMEHKYGAHIFNTDSKYIYDYVESFGKLVPYVHRVKAVYDNKVYSFPINLHTINQVVGKDLDPTDARKFINSVAIHNSNPKNFEEQAISMIGAELYNIFFFGYTKKQWGCSPRELPASIMKRIPVRFNYDDNFHLHQYTAIPKDGYTAIMKSMISSPRINLYLGRQFRHEDAAEYDHVFYTGAIDGYFNYCHGRLGYRTVNFTRSVIDIDDYQGCAQMNFCNVEIPFTRIIEHKHFAPHEQSKGTIVYHEFSKETGAADIPYYPKRLPADMIMLNRYQYDADKLSNVSFLGRLGTYRYMDMHVVIKEAIEVADNFIASCKKKYL